MAKKKEKLPCVTCGKPLPKEGWYSALCPECLVEAKVKDNLKYLKEQLPVMRISVVGEIHVIHHNAKEGS